MIDFDFEKQVGRPFHYFCNGAAVTEVEIDCLTGDHQVVDLFFFFFFFFTRQISPNYFITLLFIATKCTDKCFSLVKQHLKAVFLNLMRHIKIHTAIYYAIYLLHHA